jgi:GR25 family glycosyltransferase involved in LPS biosynthesis
MLTIFKINGSFIHQKAKPAHRHHDKRDLEKRINQLEYGCWRSHADAWQKVIDDNVETAL